MLHGPGRSAGPPPRQAGPRWHGRRSGPRLRCRRGGIGRMRDRDGPPRASTALHHVYVRRLDARDARSGRLRPSTTLWQLMLASLAFNALETAGTIVWATVKQRHVPGAMLGRVSSLDWLISIGLLPVSLASPVLSQPRSDARHAHRRRSVGAAATCPRCCSCACANLRTTSRANNGAKRAPGHGAASRSSLRRVDYRFRLNAAPPLCLKRKRARAMCTSRGFSFRPTGSRLGYG